ncbi:hypothetical protein B4U37_11050 [Sutcliffiella horikoshii]|uniref:Glycerophosphoryl diester phosphodiesterase membrane domain-containing protein n=1 Tax=Sutcliffiella horikoshii TaxID=79883 RepID=A0ABM6KJA1_9BACI|nr:hypothetical protein [Sutcliffiella horikoshii]ART76541.1 hypothetical protein B4U37_11050 [Sutcliffiella horikoshii]
MNNNLNKPKGFGEILDQTFKISKYKFKDFFIILLLLVGPIYILQAIIELATGKSFFRQEGGGGAWYEEMMRNMELTEEASLSSNLAADIGTLFVSLLVLFTYPVAQAAILFGVNHIKHNREFTASTIVKQAFGRFFPLIGSSLLYVIIAFSILFGFILLGVLIPIIFFSIDIIAGVIVTIVLTISLFLIGAFLLTRWSFFFGSVVLDKNSPGLTRSWRLSKGRTFKLIGLYIIFFLITTSIGVAIEMSVSAFLGNSVLLGLIVGFSTLFTTLIMAVGYAVMYLDLKVRHDADDLRDLIDDYHIR